MPDLTLSSGTFFSPTIDVRRFTGISFRFMAMVGNTTVTIQQSPAGLTWTDSKVLTLPTKNVYYYDFDKTITGHIRVLSNNDLEVVMKME